MELNDSSGGPHVLALAVGNTRSAMATFQGTRMETEAVALPNTDLGAITRAALDAIAADHQAIVVMSSVNDPVADELEDRLSAAQADRVYRLGRDLEIPIPNALADDSTVGQDRLLCALGAHERAEQACVVIDAGTAITVDFVDGEGTFQGGAIAPGLGMMLRAMHQFTAALPEIKYENPDPSLGPFGKDTRHAMLMGVRHAALGLARSLIEKYSESFGAYPQIIATGGDARLLFEGDDLVENIVPELQLIGIAVACARVLKADDELDAEPDGQD